MKQLLYITSNPVKLAVAKHTLEPAGIKIVHITFDFDELQAGGEQIARHKAQQAYTHFRQPLVISDDTWDIPGLNGFPGAFMKDINHWFTAQDWLNLTRPLKDRRIILNQHLIYQEADGQHYFTRASVGELLKEARGQTPLIHLAITSFDGGKTSGAEHIDAGQSFVANAGPTAWNDLLAWLLERGSDEP